MKIVFYRTLLKGAKGLTPSEKILYSFLVAKSITRIDCAFETRGMELCLENITEEMQYNNNYIALCELNHCKIAKELHQTRKTIIDGLRHLEELGYIRNDRIFANERLISHGYFELVHAEILKGELLIFYSYLLNKSEKYKYCIDTYKDAIGQQLGKTKVAITKLLNRLYEVGLAERLDNGKLLLKY